ncbi:hypothetical protein ACFO3D_08650 [Virgibacillus kekensis]|uniref:Uncharacterized protein n=1 Tax=Virgibacillus kekensis TaxID=202261 RepID=A0ABV9DIP5_9BACI
MSKRGYAILQFAFPVLAVLVVATGAAGSATPLAFIGLVLIGFMFSVYLVVAKRIILWGLINIVLTLGLLFYLLFIFYIIISSGV